MRAKENLELIEELQRAVRGAGLRLIRPDARDDEATIRTAGVPSGLGGVLTGRQAIVDQIRQTAGAGSVAIEQIFGDGKHVCTGSTTTSKTSNTSQLRSGGGFLV